MGSGSRRERGSVALGFGGGRQPSGTCQQADAQVGLQPLTETSTPHSWTHTLELKASAGHPQERRKIHSEEEEGKNLNIKTQEQGSK